jgi:hypothetical protein
MARRRSQDRRPARGFHESPAFGPVLALIAAIIVAGASVGSNWYLDERAEQRDNRRALYERIREYQEAKRLVDDELVSITEDLEFVYHVREVPALLPRNPPQEVFLPSTAWEQYKEVLARDSRTSIGDASLTCMGLFAAFDFFSSVSRAVIPSVPRGSKQSTRH